MTSFPPRASTAAFAPCAERSKYSTDDVWMYAIVLPWRLGILARAGSTAPVRADAPAAASAATTARTASAATASARERGATTEAARIPFIESTLSLDDDRLCVRTTT